MKVYRYMSMDEFASMAAWVDMYPRTRHHKARTSSKGFCFLPEEVHIYDDDGTYTMSPVGALTILSGIVCEDVLVEFDAPEGSLEESEGVYANPYSDSYGDFVGVDELCCEFYSRETLVPLRYMPSPSYSDSRCQWYQFF